MEIEHVFTKKSFKIFRSLTQNIIDLLPHSLSVFEAISVFINKYEENSSQIDKELAMSLEIDSSYLSIKVKLFYICMALRIRYPNFFPAPTLCILLASCIDKEVKTHKIAKLYLQSTELLPLVFLLSDEITDIYFTFAESTSIKALEQNFRENEYFYENSTNWHCYNDKEPENTAHRCRQSMQKDGFLLMQYPHASPTDKECFVTEDFQTKIIYTSWNFLSNGEYRQVRKDLITSMQLDSVIQLPLPSREGNKNYPALLVLNKQAGQENQKVKMYDLNSLANHLEHQKYFSYTKDSLNVLLDHLHKSPEQETFSDTFSYKILVPNTALLEEKGQRLTPSYYILQNKNTDKDSSRPLSDFAEILRFQDTRLSHKSSEIIHFQNEDFGKTLFREANLKDIDELTGFYLSDDANFVEVQTPFTKLNKHILKDGDILFTFKGSRTTIGKVGYVDINLNKEPEESKNDNDTFSLHGEIVSDLPSITGNSFVIIRPKQDVPPFVLFHYLKQSKIQQLLQSKASGTSVLSINITAIKNIPLTAPEFLEDSQKVEGIYNYYNELKQGVQGILQHKRQLKDLKKTKESQLKLV